MTVPAPMRAAALGTLLQVAVVLGLTATAVPVARADVCTAQEGGIGGTGARAEGGIGGTGARAEGGIGGTGARADGGVGGTGIVGTITGFASVCVNGLEVHYDANTPVTVDGRAAPAGELAIGQVVSAEAEVTQSGLRARGI
jgi:hypothetical protein